MEIVEDMLAIFTWPASKGYFARKSCQSLRLFTRAIRFPTVTVGTLCSLAMKEGQAC